MAAMFLALAAVGECADGEASLTADSMNYDPRTGWIVVSGNVHFTRPDGELFGDRGGGSANGQSFEIHGNVRGSFSAESLDIACESLNLSSVGGSTARRRITASGDVVLTRRADRLSAESVTWEMGRNSYKASGGVTGTLGGYYIDSDLAARNGNQFWAHNLRRYEDRRRNIRLSAAKASGLMQGDAIVELVADGGVSMNMPDSQGLMSTVTGDKGVYSVARGTIVITGNATVTQGARKLRASSIVYHLNSGRVEAIGQPTLVIGTQGN
jgi:lipopolysaccharide export system protein LptA